MEKRLEIHPWFTTDEYQIVREAAARAAVPIKTFCRAATLAEARRTLAEPRPGPPAAPPGPEAAPPP